MSKSRPKFKVGDVVAYRGDRRTRRRIVSRYWDASFPAWRYKIDEQHSPRMKRLGYAALWAPVESAFVLVRRPA